MIARQLSSSVNNDEDENEDGTNHVVIKVLVFIYFLLFHSFIIYFLCFVFFFGLFFCSFMSYQIF